MNPDSQPATLLLQVNVGDDADAEERDYLTRQLLTEVRDLDVESADLVSGGDVPEGAKAAEALTMGTLAVAVLPATMAKLVECLFGWMRRGDDRHIVIKTQVGDRALELEFTPETVMSQQDLENFAQRLTTMLSQKESE